MAFTQNLNYCMEQSGYSAYRLAKLIGATNQAVLNWQAGKAIPHLKTRQKIADHFGITLEALDGESTPQLSPKREELLFSADIKKAPAADTGDEREGYTDMELLAAYRAADERTRSAIRTLLGIPEQSGG